MELPEFLLSDRYTAAFGKQHLENAGQRRMRSQSKANLNNIQRMGEIPIFLTVENLSNVNHFPSAGESHHYQSRFSPEKL